MKIVERDATSNGYDWTATYDAFGRRLQTVTSRVVNGTNLTTQPTVAKSFFDPEVEFLEIGASINGKTSWKLYGPDANGRYGGLQGVGGLDAISEDPGTVYLPIVDALGNIVGHYDKTHSTNGWHSSRVLGYGAVSEFRPLSLGESPNFSAAAAWRGKTPDLSGLYWLGARYYDPVSGRFISCDPLGHDTDPSLYAFCNGDPINRFDADGRFGKASGVGGTVGVTDFAAPLARLGSMVGPTGSAGVALINWGQQGVHDWGDSVSSGFNNWQGNVYAGSSFIGEVAPNFIPIGGLQSAAAKAVARAEAWAVSKLPFLGDDLGVLAGRALNWLDNTAPRLNLRNYKTDPAQVNIGIPLPRYVPPSTASKEGVIYLRMDGKGGEYVGQAESAERYIIRQSEHAAEHPTQSFTFQELERIPANSGRSLNVAEEDWIRAGGGAKSTGGRLQNDRHQMSDANYKSAGGTIEYP